MKEIDIINSLPDKQYRWKSTTSLKFKQDLYNFFKDKNIENALELGTNQGLTTIVLSLLAKNVYTIELMEHNVTAAKEHCIQFIPNVSNIQFIHGDVRDDHTYDILTGRVLDLVLIDCIHEFDSVINDINRSLKYFNESNGMYFIFDDYSHPGCPEIRQAIDYAVSNGFNVEMYIGHTKGHQINRNDGTSFKLNGHEGIILSYGINKD